MLCSVLLVLTLGFSSAFSPRRALSLSATRRCSSLARGAVRAAAGRTLYDKVFDAHKVASMGGDSTVLMYIDRHLVHEVRGEGSPRGLPLGVVE